MVFLVDSTDHVTGKTGLTLTITASKDGGAFGSITPTVTERGTGWYSLALTTAHTDTLGDLALHITGTAADPLDVVLQVVAFDPASATNLGLSNLDATISSRSTFAGGAVASVTADVGITQAAADKVWGTAARTLTSFGTLVADVWAYATRTLSSFGSLVGDVWANATRTLTSSLDPTAAVIADAVWDEAIAGHLGAGSCGEKLNAAASAGDPWTTALPGAYGAGSAGKIVGDNLNATVGSRAPEAAGNIAAIKTKTDQLVFTIANKVDASIQAAGDFAQAAADKAWSSASRTLTSFGTLVADIWAYATRTLSSFGTLVVDVWTYATRSLTDKAEFSLAAGQLAVKKNTALANFEFLMVDSADHITPKTGLAVTGERSIDGGAFAACANAVTEVASGIYKITLAATDLNGNVITFKFAAAGADARFVTLVTQA